MKDSGRVLNGRHHSRPIPQWFRLKTDTKIQVRLVDRGTTLPEFLTMLPTCSITPSAVTGGAPNSTFERLFIVGMVSREGDSKGQADGDMSTHPHHVPLACNHDA